MAEWSEHRVGERDNPSSNLAGTWPSYRRVAEETQDPYIPGQFTATRIDWAWCHSYYTAGLPITIRSAPLHLSALLRWPRREGDGARGGGSVCWREGEGMGWGALDTYFTPLCHTSLTVTMPRPKKYYIAIRLTPYSNVYTHTHTHTHTHAHT